MKELLCTNWILCRCCTCCTKKNSCFHIHAVRETPGKVLESWKYAWFNAMLQCRMIALADFKNIYIYIAMHKLDIIHWKVRNCSGNVQVKLSNGEFLQINLHKLFYDCWSIWINAMLHCRMIALADFKNIYTVEKIPVVSVKNNAECMKSSIRVITLKCLSHF